MAKTDGITQEYLRSILDYDMDTGIFRWKISKPGISIGKIAGTLRQGYVAITINRVQYLAHRLAWLYVTGDMPAQIDHKNVHGLRSDNRICNLRPATQAQNSRNRGISRRNTTGYKGVYFEKSRNKFRASIRFDGVNIRLGRYSTAEEAHKAYCCVAEKLHGEFACFK